MQVAERFAVSMIVSKHSPHQVLDCDQSLQDLLGYKPHEVVGRSIKFLFGPETNIVKVYSAIKGAP